MRWFMTDILKFKANFETKKVEFKQILNDGEKAINWLKTVASFCNTFGGHLYIGVNDSGEPVGLPKKLVDSQVQLFLRNVKEHISPEPKVTFDYIELENETFIIDIEIEASKELPVTLTFHNTPSIYVRDEGRNRPANRQEIISMVLANQEDRFDNRETNIIFKEKDFTYLYETFKKRREKNLSAKNLESVGFMNDEGYLKSGSKLFMDDFNESETTLKITKRKGISKGDNEFLKLLDIHKNILEAIDLAFETIKENISFYERKTINSREEVYDFPLRALFEGIVNAFAHKNYFLKDSVIEINIFKDRLEITSPGSLISDVTLINEKDIEGIKPTRRNNLICNVLSMCKYMEREGSGFTKITEDYLREDANHKPFVTSKNNYFTLTLPNVNYDYGVINETNGLPEITCVLGDFLSDKEKEILSYCYLKTRTIDEIAKQLNMTLSTYFRKKIITPLVDNNLLIKGKQGKADTYLSNKELVKLK